MPKDNDWFRGVCVDLYSWVDRAYKSGPYSILPTTSPDHFEFDLIIEATGLVEDGLVGTASSDYYVGCEGADVVVGRDGVEF